MFEEEPPEEPELPPLPSLPLLARLVLFATRTTGSTMAKTTTTRIADVMIQKSGRFQNGGREEVADFSEASATLDALGVDSARAARGPYESRGVAVTNDMDGAVARALAGAATRKGWLARGVSKAGV